MRFLLSVVCLAAAASAADPGHPPPFKYAFRNNLDGSYHFEYAASDSARAEDRTRCGETSGAYSYLDSAGAVQSVRYAAGVAGVKIAGTNLPVGSTTGPDPVADLPEVVQARAEHFYLAAEHLKLVEAEKLRNADAAAGRAVFVPSAPRFFASQAAVTDEPQVVEAREKFLFEHAKRTREHLQALRAARH